MKKVKLAMVGVGSISVSHLDAYAKVEDVEIYAFCDINPDRLAYMGEKYGVNVIFSAELLLNESSNHYLLYGVDKDFLVGCEEIFDMTIAELCEYARARGVTVIQAHPYRDGKNTPAPVGTVEAIEAHNANPRHDNYTEQALEYAARVGLPITAGSDTHRYEDVARTGVMTKYEIKTAEDYIRAVMSGELIIIR